MTKVRTVLLTAVLIVMTALIVEETSPDLGNS